MGGHPIHICKWKCKLDDIPSGLHFGKKNCKPDGGPSDSHLQMKMWTGWYPIRFTFWKKKL